MLETLDSKDIASLLRIKLSTLQNRLSTRPESLPPKLKLPGQKTPIWLSSKVMEWLGEHAV
jgi:predicted DNA-binding transcriptional regulator AlpA